MLGFGKRKDNANEEYDTKKNTSVYDILDETEELKESVELHAEKLNNFIEAVRDDYKQQIAHLKVELSDVKDELRKKNIFLEQLITQLIENGAAKKPMSATEAYLAKKATDGSKPIPLPGK